MDFDIRELKILIRLVTIELEDIRSYPRIQSDDLSHLIDQRYECLLDHLEWELFKLEDKDRPVPMLTEWNRFVLGLK